MDPSNEYCGNKQQGLKPPQETTCLFCSEIENKLPINKQFILFDTNVRLLTHNEAIKLVQFGWYMYFFDAIS